MFFSNKCPKRWSSQTKPSEIVWAHYENLASELVQAALRKGGTLLRLYHALSRLRGKCESLKAMQLKLSEIPFAANGELPFLNNCFGMMSP